MNANVNRANNIENRRSFQNNNFNNYNIKINDDNYDQVEEVENENYFLNQNQNQKRINVSETNFKYKFLNTVLIFISNKEHQQEK